MTNSRFSMPNFQSPANESVLVLLSTANAGAIISFCIRLFGAILASMGQRREARERAVQFLFQHDLNPPDNLEEALAHFWGSQRAPAIAEEKAPATWGQKDRAAASHRRGTGHAPFCRPLIRGVLEHLPRPGSKRSPNTPKIGTLTAWRSVDRNILRLAIYEMLHRDDIPPVVSINEAVDIAKKFSTAGQRQIRQRHPGQDQGRIVAAGPHRQMNPSPVIDSESRRQGSPPRTPPAGPAGFADLHLHTLFSDGTFTPEELADRGGRLGLGGDGPDRPRHRRRLRAHGPGLRTRSASSLSPARN